MDPLELKKIIYSPERLNPDVSEKFLLDIMGSSSFTTDEERPLEELDYTFDPLHVFHDGRIEDCAYASEYYTYSPDKTLFGGTWEEGLQAIDEHDWSESALHSRQSQNGNTWEDQPKETDEFNWSDQVDRRREFALEGVLELNNGSVITAGKVGGLSQDHLELLSDTEGHTLVSDGMLGTEETSYRYKVSGAKNNVCTSSSPWTPGLPRKVSYEENNPIGEVSVDTWPLDRSVAGQTLNEDQNAICVDMDTATTKEARNATQSQNFPGLPLQYTGAVVDVDPVKHHGKSQYSLETQADVDVHAGPQGLLDSTPMEPCSRARGDSEFIASIGDVSRGVHGSASLSLRFSQEHSGQHLARSHTERNASNVGITAAEEHWETPVEKAPRGFNLQDMLSLGDAALLEKSGSPFLVELEVEAATSIKETATHQIYQPHASFAKDSLTINDEHTTYEEMMSARESSSQHVFDHGPDLPPSPTATELDTVGAQKVLVAKKLSDVPSQISQPDLSQDISVLKTDSINANDEPLEKGVTEPQDEIVPNTASYWSQSSPVTLPPIVPTITSAAEASPTGPNAGTQRKHSKATTKLHPAASESDESAPSRKKQKKAPIKAKTAEINMALTDSAKNATEPWRDNKKHRAKKSMKKTTGSQQKGPTAIYEETQHDNSSTEMQDVASNAAQSRVVYNHEAWAKEQQENNTEQTGEQDTDNSVSLFTGGNRTARTHEPASPPVKNSILGYELPKIQRMPANPLHLDPTIGPPQGNITKSRPMDSLARISVYRNNPGSTPINSVSNRPRLFVKKTRFGPDGEVIKIDEGEKETEDCERRDGSVEERNPLDLGYGKRHTRADTRYAEKRSNQTANLTAVQGEEENGQDTSTENNSLEKPAQEMVMPKTKAASTSKSRAELRSSSGNDKAGAARTTSKRMPKSGPGNFAPAKSSTAASSSAAPKFGFKPPRGSRVKNAKKQDNGAAVLMPGTGRDTSASASVTGKRQTRRASAQQDELERKKEKEENIGLRLRSSISEGRDKEEKGKVKGRQKSS